jgi:predicted house-cleaning noncanonical NTP pyrophosphatase (MazG superfamily)
MTVYRKLVRYRIPEIIERAGKTPVWRQLDNAELRDALSAKLVEEATEARNADDSTLLSELADVTETVEALLLAYGYAQSDLQSERSRRNAERGTFAKRIFLERVDEQ